MSCTCFRCVEACTLNPGWMTPGEATKAMDAGLAGKLMLDWLAPCTEVGNSDRIWLLAPASIGHEGKTAPDCDISFFDWLAGVRWSKGQCVFLENDRCAIHDSGYKPMQCRECFACHVEDPGPDNYDMARLWQSDEARAVVERWKKEVRHVEACSD